MLFWLLIGLLAGIMTLEWEAPQSCRTIIVIPAAILLAGVPLCGLDIQLGKIFGRWKWIPFLAIATPLVLWITRENYNYYFVRMQNNSTVYQEFVGRDTAIARYLEGLDRNKHFFVHQQREVDYPTLPFFLKRESLTGVLYRSPEHLPLRIHVGRNVHYLLEDWRVPIPEETFKHYYPGGAYKEYSDPWGKEIFYTYIIASAEANSIPGLQAHYRAVDSAVEGRRAWDRIERPPFNVREGKDAPPRVPLLGHWTGSLYVDAVRTYRFGWKDRSPLRVAFDDAALPKEGRPVVEIRLSRGWHNIELVRRIEPENESFELEWSGRPNRFEKIPLLSFCHKKLPGNGFYARYYGNTTWQEPAHHVQMDPLLSIRWHPEPIIGKLQWSAKWMGFLRVDKEGMYGFNVRCNSYCRIEVDGEVVLEQKDRASYPGKRTIKLGAGEHKIDVFYKETGQYSELHVLWQPPGRGEEIIPLAHLRPRFQE